MKREGRGKLRAECVPRVLGRGRLRHGAHPAATVQVSCYRVPPPTCLIRPAPPPFSGPPARSDRFPPHPFLRPVQPGPAIFVIPPPGIVRQFSISAKFGFHANSRMPPPPARAARAPVPISCPSGRAAGKAGTAGTAGTETDRCLPSPSVPPNRSACSACLAAIRGMLPARPPPGSLRARRVTAMQAKQAAKQAARCAQNIGQR